MKRIYFYTGDNYPKGTCADYESTMWALQKEEKRINTTQLSLLDFNYWMDKGYQCFIIHARGYKIEIRLGDIPSLPYPLTRKHNVFKMLMEGKFDFVAGDVTGTAERIWGKAQ